MKKDMGGAATVMGLAHMIMALKLPVRLRVLVPAVENAISGSAMRPARHPDLAQGPDGRGQQYRCRGAADPGRCAGLADAEEAPDLLISMATLTGCGAGGGRAGSGALLHRRRGPGAGAGSGRWPRCRSGLAACRSGPLRADDRAGHRRSGQRAVGRALPGRSPRRCSCAALSIVRAICISTSTPILRPMPPPGPRAASGRARGRSLQALPQMLGL